MFVGDTKRGIALQKKGRELLKAIVLILSKTLPKFGQMGMLRILSGLFQILVQEARTDSH